MSDVRAFVVEARLVLDDGCAPAAVGAAVTTALCGHWKHEGPCRWPHNNAVNTASKPVLFRTLFVSQGAEELVVRRRIETALRNGPGWRLVSSSARAVAEEERSLAQRLVAAPRAQG